MTQCRSAALGAKAALVLSICVGAAPLVATEKSSEASSLMLSQSTQPKSSGSAQPKSPTQREGARNLDAPAWYDHRHKMARTETNPSKLT